MKRSVFEELRSFGRRALWGGGLVGLLLAGAASAIGDLSSEGRRAAEQIRRRNFSLFAGPTAVLEVNLLQCGIRSDGDICTNIFNSPTGGGGFWPSGSVDQYIFNTGMQMAGIISEDAGFEWAADTVAYYSFDASGPQKHSTPLTDVFVSTNPDDAANWPDAARVTDPDLFQDVLLGRVAASQEDSWVQYWDGDPALNARRSHPMGIRVTQRSLAWNFPLGNESVIYFLFNFQNVSDEAEFQRLNELQFFGGENAIPDAGYRIDSIYAAFSTDMDVTAAFDQNMSTAILPFSLGLSYNGLFTAGEFVYPPALFRAPFFLDAPGLVGVKYLRSPINQATGEEVGLTMFSNTQNPSQPGAVFFDPQGDTQLFRYLAGSVSPQFGDTPCNITPSTPTVRPLCFILQGPSDTRFYQSSGPFSLDAGTNADIVVAYIVAATVETLPDGSPTVTQTTTSSDNAPGIPSFHPGFESRRGCDVNGDNCSVVRTPAENAVLPIEKAAGWVAYTGASPADGLEVSDNRLDQFQVEVVPESLLGKALVAQTIFDNKFLLGFAPDAPRFFLVPGSNQISILWEASPSEEAGDPFAQVAADPASALFNPNYRGDPDDPEEAKRSDVEGYRIFRGTSPANVQLVAQFDHTGTSFLDFTCETVLPGEDVHDLTDGESVKTVTQAGDTVDVLGYAAGDICPLSVGGDVIVRDIVGLVFNNGGPGGPPGGGVVRLQNLDAQAISLDTAALAGGTAQGLGNTGVPFAFIDAGVRNNFTYFYEVRAFDVNSQSSGPSSLVSGSFSLSASPREDAQNLVTAVFQSFISGDDGVPLNPNAAAPSIDAANGTFSGPFPPTDATTLGFLPLVERLLPQFTRTARIDSVVPDVLQRSACGPPLGGTGFDFVSQCVKVYVTVDADGQLSQIVTPMITFTWGGGFGTASAVTSQIAASTVPFDPASLASFGIPSGSGAATVDLTIDNHINFSAFEGQQNRRGAVSRTLHGGSRWFDGMSETVPDPTAFIRVGHLDAVDTVWAPIHHTQLAPGSATTLPNSGTVQFFGYLFGYLTRSADVRFTWGGGTFAEARDVTHNVNVDFSPDVRASWGFLNDDADGDGIISWLDYFYITSACAVSPENIGICGPGQEIELESSPQIVPLHIGTEAAPTADCNGFALYVNAERYSFCTDAIPADGTVWTLRTYSGRVRTGAATTDVADPSGYSWGPIYDGTGLRPSFIPGLELHFEVEQGSQVVPTRDLTQVHTVPDPYLATSPFDLAPTEKNMMFVNLPPRATVRVYSLTGVLVRSLEHDDPTGGGRMVWNMRNRNNQFIASGVYFFHVTTPDGDEHVGKFTVVNFAGSN